MQAPKRRRAHRATVLRAWLEPRRPQQSGAAKRSMALFASCFLTEFGRRANSVASSQGQNAAACSVHCRFLGRVGHDTLPRPNSVALWGTGPFFLERLFLGQRHRLQGPPLGGTRFGFLGVVVSPERIDSGRFLEAKAENGPRNVGVQCPGV